MTAWKPASATVRTEHLPFAFVALQNALEEALLIIAERDGTDDWAKEPYERIAKRLDGLGLALMASSTLAHAGHPVLNNDVSASVRAGAAAVDATFDAVVAARNRPKTD